MVDLIYQLLAFATLTTHGLIIALISLWIFERTSKRDLPGYVLVQDYSYALVFLATFIAFLGSLFFSEIAQFPPCILCWYQRILMYPQVILSYVSLMRNEAYFMKPYLIILSIIGAGISLYHNFILWFPQYYNLQCSTKGGVSCIEGYTTYFGYITIPLMALTVFVFNIIILSLYGKPRVKKVRLPN